MDKIKESAKAIAALVGSIATGLLAVYTGDTEVGKVLTVIAIVATAVGTWAVPNRPSMDLLPPNPYTEPDEWDHLDDEPV